MDKKIKVIIENHFDQIWRRCFKRDIVWDGKRFISYSEIEKNYIDKNLELCNTIPNYKFQIESPCAVETYLELSPDKEELIKSLYAKGILKTANTGYVIVDSNMIGCEAIIRNYLISDVFFQKFVGETPKIANRSDAFGNSGQLPQILRSFGAEYVMGIDYNPYEDDVWVGIDESAICVKRTENLGGGGGWYKYAPCKKCNGFGKLGDTVCDECFGLCIDKRIETKWNDLTLKPCATQGGIVRVGGEELMPNEKTHEQIEELRHKQGLDISFGHWDHYLEIFKKEIEQINKKDFRGLKVRMSPEFNPNSTGGYTTRIKIKQRLVECENKLLAGETLEAMRYICGKTPFSYDKVWRDYLLCGFHDSAAGTVVDQGYNEIMDLFSNIDAVTKERYLLDDISDRVCLFNPTSRDFKGIYRSTDGRIANVSNIAPYSFSTVSFAPPPERIDKEIKESAVLTEVILTGKSDASAYCEGDVLRIENEFFLIEADNNGICSIVHKQLGVISEETDGVRPCEWIVEDDFGSPWARLIPPYSSLPQRNKTKLVCIEQGADYVRLCYKINFGFPDLNIVSDSYVEWSLMLINGYDRIKFDAKVCWDAAEKSLIIGFPVSIENSRDIYGIPGGWIERTPYVPSYSQNGADGDYPAFRFGGVQSNNKSVALFNRGTLAYKILPSGMGKTIYMTVLRSPINPTYLHEPISYSMTEYDGMRDRGMHSFEFELAAYGTPFSNSKVFMDAEQFSRPPLCIKEPIHNVTLPAVISEGVSVTHVKLAENGKGIIVRVTEQSGTDREAVISVPSWVKEIYMTDMSEKTSKSLDLRKDLKISLRAFEIASLRFIK